MKDILNDETNNIAIVKSDEKTYNLHNIDEAINFLIFALNGKYHAFFIDFLLSHIGINTDEYFSEKATKSIYDVQNDVRPFFNFFCIDYNDDNVFYKYIYNSKESDFIKKQKINKIIEGLEKTLEHYFDFRNVLIFINCEIDDEYAKVYDYAKRRELRDTFIYFCICKMLINFYDYLFDDYYVFIDSKNSFKYRYSNKWKNNIKRKIELNKKETIQELYVKETWFKVGIDFANGKIFNLIENNISFNKIAQQLYNNNTYRNTISESISLKPSNINKSIFHDINRMEKIIEYFKANKWNVDFRFTQKYESFKEINF